MFSSSLLISLVLAIGANLLADRFVALDVKLSCSQLTTRQKHTRIIRWCVFCCGLVALGLLGLRSHRLLVLALFGVSAATDLETKLLPPDAYVFGCVLLNLVLVGIFGGSIAFHDAIVAQALCFAVVTLGVAFLNWCEGGDIKLAMQFGVVCGTLPLIAVSAVCIWLVALLLVLLACTANLIQRPRHDVLGRTASFRPPLGPLMWCGLLIGQVLIAWYGGTAV